MGYYRSFKNLYQLHRGSTGARNWLGKCFMLGKGAAFSVLWSLTWFLNEIKYLSKQWGVDFQHISREVHEVEDPLAKKGTSLEDVFVGLSLCFCLVPFFLLGFFVYVGNLGFCLVKTNITKTFRNKLRGIKQVFSKEFMKSILYTSLHFEIHLVRAYAFLINFLYIVWSCYKLSPSE